MTLTLGELGSLSPPFCLPGVSRPRKRAVFDKTRQQFDPSGRAAKPAGPQQPLGCLWVILSGAPSSSRVHSGHFVNTLSGTNELDAFHLTSPPMRDRIFHHLKTLHYPLFLMIFSMISRFRNLRNECRTQATYHRRKFGRIRKEKAIARNFNKILGRNRK